MPADSQHIVFTSPPASPCSSTSSEGEYPTEAEIEHLLRWDEAEDTELVSSEQEDQLLEE